MRVGGHYVFHVCRSIGPGFFFFFFFFFFGGGGGGVVVVFWSGGGGRCDGRWAVGRGGRGGGSQEGHLYI